MPRYRTVIEFDSLSDDDAKSHVELLKRQQEGDMQFSVVDNELTREATWWEKVK